MTYLKGFFGLDSRLKFLIWLAWDLGVLVFALISAYWLRIGFDGWHFSYVEWKMLVASSIFTISLLIFLGHYRQVIRYIGIKAVYIVAIAIGCSTFYLFAAKYALGAFVPNTVPIIFAFSASVLMLAPRLLIQFASQTQSYRIREKCIIYGAAEAGRSLAESLKAGNHLLPVAFIDDKSKYQGKQLLGLPVGTRDDIPELVQKYQVTKMLLAVHHTSELRRKQLIGELAPYAIELLSIPNIQDIASGKRKINELREVKIEELLGRNPVPPITELLDVNIRSKEVMVTGAGGSIGSELCRQIAKSKPAKLILFELSEYNLYQIENELRIKHADLQIIPVMANILDNDAIRRVLDQHNVHTIYHAAAYKHVPMVESNPLAGLRNNVFGTSNMALAAAEFDVEKFVLVSTDKAVRPTNIMGATKRFAELFIQGIAEVTDSTEYAIVRFGNVLGSSGSVVPLFTKQIKAGGPITVTHPDIIRYFMTIPEAAQLVIQAGAMGKKGEVFVLDMGEPVKIVDLATKMAHLMGLSVKSDANPDGDIELNFSGLRPGEKLYEELLIDDADTTTDHPRIMGADESKQPFDYVLMLLDEFNQALLNNNEGSAKQMLQQAPLAYQPAAN